MINSSHLQHLTCSGVFFRTGLWLPGGSRIDKIGVVGGSPWCNPVYDGTALSVLMQVSVSNSTESRNCGSSYGRSLRQGRYDIYVLVFAINTIVNAS